VRESKSGVRNAVDTVVVDKAMTAAEAYRQLAGFVSDGLSTHGCSDLVAPEELQFARSLWPFQVS
jgi:hypothetical protein